MFMRRLFTNSRLLLLLLWLISGMVLLGLAPGAQAANGYETWTGPFSIKLSIVEYDYDTGKLVKKSGSDAGTVEFYIGPDGPTQDGDGYYMRFISNTDGLVVAITDLDLQKSNIPGSKTDTLFGVGSGIYFGPGSQGPAFIDVSKGTVAKDGTGNYTSLSMTAKMGGGVHLLKNGSAQDNQGNDNYVWHGSTKFTLSPP